MSKLISVDIQEEYKSHFSFSVLDFIKYLHEFEGPILYFYNGEDVGYTGNPKNWLMDTAYEELGEEFGEEFYLETLERIEFVPKGYAFFRDVMDAGWDNEDIINAIKVMFDTNIPDSRNLDRELLEEKTDLEEEQIDGLLRGDYAFYLPGIEGVLQGWCGATLIGGGSEECLAEVALLMEAMDCNYNFDQRFIY